MIIRTLLIVKMVSTNMGGRWHFPSSSLTVTAFTGYTLAMQPSRAWNLITWGILLGSAAWIWFSRTTTSSTTAGLIPAPHPGFLSPGFTLLDDTGQQVQLSDYFGQPVLINFWASWCQPCRAEMPAMQRIYAKYAAQGFVILAVNGTFQDNPAEARQFAHNLGLTFPILFDPQGEIADMYDVRAWPTSIFVDRDGIIRDVIIGGPMAEALLEIRVQQLLDQADSGGD